MNRGTRINLLVKKTQKRQRLSRVQLVELLKWMIPVSFWWPSSTYGAQHARYLASGHRLAMGLSEETYLGNFGSKVLK